MKRWFWKIFNFLFTLGHLAFMVAFALSGFFLSLEWVVLIYMLLELQLIVFNGCFATKIQRKTKGLKKWEDFIPHLYRKVFHRRMSDKKHMWVSFVMMSTPVYVALVKSFFFN